MRLPTHDEFEDDGPGLTPLIDVVFLLLIFFLVATTFSQDEKDPTVNLARILKAQPITSGPKDVIVNVTKDGEYIVEKEKLTEGQLFTFLGELATRNPGMRRVMIRADRDVKFHYPATVMGICLDKKIKYVTTVLEEQG